MSRSKYINTYVKNKYDRITLQVPKGTKEEWKALAADNGLSLNEYICRLVAGNQVEIFDRMQIADKYRRMIRTLTGNTKDGYTVTLKAESLYDRRERRLPQYGKSDGEVEPACTELHFA